MLERAQGAYGSRSAVPVRVIDADRAALFAEFLEFVACGLECMQLVRALLSAVATPGEPMASETFLGGDDVVAAVAAETRREQSQKNEQTEDDNGFHDEPP